MASKPSLLNPDLTGLWSTARLGHKKAWWSKIAGTIVISIFIYSWIGSFLIPFLILFLFLMKYYTSAIMLSSIIILPYFISIPPQPWICRLYMRYGAHYFDGGCSQSMEGPPTMRDPNTPICAGCHPHGLLCIGYFLVCGIRFRAIQDVKDIKIQKEFSDMISQWKNFEKRIFYTGLVVGYLAKAPLFNLFICKITGCVESSSSNNMKCMMSRGKSFGILPGGFNEATLFRKGENVIYIRNRKGFIKYCLQYGYEIYASYIFGECETYNNLFYSHTDNNWVMNIKRWLNKKQIPTVFPIGQYWFVPFLPYRNTGIHAIFSGKTRCAKIEHPTQEQIDEYHEWYMNEVNELFERHKWRFGYSQHVKLKIV